jgi:hypothetical protein
LIADGGKEQQLAGRELPPRRTGDVHNAERLLLEIQRDARVKPQSLRERSRLALNGRFQATAFDHVHVVRRQSSGAKIFRALAPGARHPNRILQIRREIIRCGIVELAGIRINKPY